MELILILIAVFILLLYGFLGGSLKSNFLKAKSDTESEPYIPSGVPKQSATSCLDVTSPDYDHALDPVGVWDEEKTSL